MGLFNDTQAADYDAKVQQEVIDFMKRNGYECKKIAQWDYTKNSSIAKIWWYSF